MRVNQGQRNVPPFQQPSQPARNVPLGTSVALRPQHPTPPAYGHQGARPTPVVTPNGNHAPTQAVAGTLLVNNHVVPGQR